MSDQKGNTGDSNTSYWNTGDRNSGYSNTGDSNTGNRNTGDRNTGDSNTGYWNTGNRNTGYSNTGYSNTGDWNTGNRNSGDRNTGDRNTGYRNSGDWNTGDRNTGFFCTETPAPTFFDKPTGLTWDEAYALVPHIDLPCGAEWVSIDQMSAQEKQENVNASHAGGYLKKHILPLHESFPLAWAGLDQEQRQQWLDLPNFNAVKFLKITGVDVREPAEVAASAPDEVVINGVAYIRKG